MKNALIILTSVSKKVDSDFPFKTWSEWLQMSSGSRLYSFAPRKAKERWPVDILHLGK